MWWKIHMCYLYKILLHEKKNINLDLDYIQEIGHAHEWCGLFENHSLSLIKEQGEMSSRICDFRGNCPQEDPLSSEFPVIFVNW